MKNVWNGKLLDVRYDSLPHWIVDCGCYSVTLRCQGSVPKSVRRKLVEISEALRAVDPACEEAEAYRRRQFAIMEHCLDQGQGFAPFQQASTASHLHQFLHDYHHEGFSIAAWVIMPNHVHLLTCPLRLESADNFFLHWQRFKKFSAFNLNRALVRKGRFWQPHWYDRWVRSPTEYQRWLAYFAANPVKAGLAREASDYPHLHLPPLE